MIFGLLQICLDAKPVLKKQNESIEVASAMPPTLVAKSLAMAAPWNGDKSCH
jgi:hypothetical protein